METNFIFGGCLFIKDKEMQNDFGLVRGAIESNNKYKAVAAVRQFGSIKYYYSDVQHTWKKGVRSSSKTRM